MQPLMFTIGVLFSQTSYALCVSGWSANLRKGPGTNYPVTWNVSKYTPLVKVGSKGGWYEVRDMDGEKHWVYRSVVTSGFKCLSIKTTRARLRSGPGTNYPTTSYQNAERYDAFRRVEKKGSWYKVEGPFLKTFWVHRSQIWRPIRRIKLSY